MDLKIGKPDLLELLSRQLTTLYLLQPSERASLERILEPVLGRLEQCFAHIGRKGFQRDGEPFFNPFHSSQYCMFLYLLSRAALTDAADRDLADKTYALNKALHGADLFYEVELPDVFLLEHPVGTVLGRATYGRFFSFQQQNTVGNNQGRYPVFGDNVALFAGAMVVGDAHIGNNCWISAGTYVKDQDVPDNSLVFGRSPDLVIKSRPADYFRQGTGFLYPDQGADG